MIKKLCNMALKYAKNKLSLTLKKMIVGYKEKIMECRLIDIQWILKSTFAKEMILVPFQ